MEDYKQAFPDATENGIIRCGKFIRYELEKGPKTDDELAIAYFETLEPDTMTPREILSEVESYWAALTIMMKNNKVSKTVGIYQLE